MKIGIFTDAYNPDINGVVTSIKMLEKELKALGHEVYVFSPSKHTPTENENLYMLKSIPLFVAKKFKFRLATFYSRPIAKEIKELNLDLVHTHTEFSLGLFGKIIARKYNLPFIHTYHTMWEDYMHYVNPIMTDRGIYTKRFARSFSKNFMKKAECIIVPSRKTQKYLKYKCNVTKPIFVLPTGIDIAPFNINNFNKEDKNILKEKYNIKKDDKIILYIGRVAQEKSIDKIVNSFKIVNETIKNTKFVIVGDGPSISSLKKQVKDLDIEDNVIFVGKINWEDIPKYYNIGDVFVNASLTETQGLTFIEAMASSLPIVCMYAKNLSEFITNNKNGLVVKKEIDFAKAIIQVLTNDNLKSNLIKNGLITAKLNSSQIFGKKLEKIYIQIISNYKHKKLYKDTKEKNKFLRRNINKLKLNLFKINFLNKFKKKG
ncbi:MAG: glycosyltransferase family 4 protein [Clostridia bacterium]